MNRRLFMALGSTLWLPEPERVRVYSFGSPELTLDDYVEQLRAHIVRQVAIAFQVPAYLLDPGYIRSVRIDLKVSL